MRNKFKWTSARATGAAGIALGAALVGGVLIAGGMASAQSPTPSASPAPSGAPRPSGSPRPSGAPSPRDGMRDGAKDHMGRGDFAARLAQALGVPQDRVEEAFRQIGGDLRARVGGMGPFGRGLADVAQRLGVTEQQLSDAMRAAIQARAGAAQPGQGQGGPGRGPGAGFGRNSEAFFDSVAQQLGGGRTGQQVRDAFSAARSNATRPDRAQIEAEFNQWLDRFAQYVGVSVEQLRQALQGIGGMPFGRGR